MSAPVEVPQQILEDVVQHVVARVKLPPGIETDDARQDARAIVVRRYTEGYRSDRLYMRVWGDLKDKYGTAWARFYRNNEPLTGSPVLTESHVPDPAPGLDLKMDIQDALQSLTETQRYVILGVLAGKTQETIANEKGVTATAVNKVYTRARAILAEKLKAYGE